MRTGRLEMEARVEPFLKGVVVSSSFWVAVQVVIFRTFRGGGVRVSIIF